MISNEKTNTTKKNGKLLQEAARKFAEILIGELERKKREKINKQSGKRICPISN